MPLNGYDRQEDVLRTVFRALQNLGPFKDRSEVIFTTEIRNAEKFFLYRHKDYTRWPGEMWVTIKPDGSCRIQLEGSFFPANDNKNRQLQRKLNKIQYGLNTKLKRLQKQKKRVDQ